MENQRARKGSPSASVRLVAALALTVLNAWIVGCAPEALAQAQDSRSVARQLSGPHAREIAIAEDAPGFGGFFVDPATRQAYAWSAIEENDEAVRDALRRYSGGGANAVILRGDYDYRDLLAWRRAITSRGSGSVSIMGAGISQSQNRIRFDVFDQEDRDRLVTIAEELEIPLEAVRISYNVNPAIVGFIAESGENINAFARGHYAILVKAEETERCGTVVILSDRSRIEVQTAPDVWSSTGRLEDLAVGAEVRVWIDTAIMTSCPGQTHGRRIQVH